MTSGPSPRDAVAVVPLRPIATPLSLGFLALAVISFVLSGYELSWIDQKTQAHLVGLVALVFAVPLQAGAAVFGFFARDPAAATGLGILAGTWATFGAAELSSTPGSTSGGLGLALCAAAVAIVVPAVATLSGKIVAGASLLVASARFGMSGAYQLTGSTAVQQAAGVIGLVLSALAVYAALAFELEAVEGRTVLPIGRHGRGRRASDDGLDEQLRRVVDEPGVRRPL